METRYFNEKGEELRLGVDIVDPSEAAYTTSNPSDPIFRKVPSNREIRIVDGKVTFALKPISRVSLLTKNIQLRLSRIRGGLLVTGNYMIRGELQPNHTEVMRVTELLKNDVHAIRTFFRIDPNHPPQVLSIAEDIYLLIENVDQANALFLGGFDLVTTCYRREAEGKALIQSVPDDQLGQAHRDIIALWDSFNIEINLLNTGA